jgi:uncharacterized tellurite resistance protein B-like protein
MAAPLCFHYLRPMLIDTIRSIFKAKSESVSPAGSAFAGANATSHEPIALAACVLLLEIAHADGEFTDVERQHLEFVLERHFALPAESGRLLMEQAERERANSVDHFSFTQLIKSEYDIGQKMTLAETMWGLVLADGEIDEHEHYLTRKISNLLDLEPGYLSAAKDAAAKRKAPGA